MAKTTCNLLSDWIVAFHQIHGDPVTNLRLQKLAYYAQAWHLALNDNPLIDEEFEAWIHGPVVPCLYRRFKSYGPDPILQTRPAQDGGESEGLLPPVGADVDAHLREVLSTYGDFNTWQLEQLTHSEAPWKEARKGLPPDSSCNNVISKESMKCFYRSLLNAENPKA